MIQSISYTHTSLPTLILRGGVETQWSTSGYYSVVRGPNSSLSISAGSKRQTSLSQSTLEAELVAADFGLRTGGLPSLSLWSVIFPHQPPLLLHEDNQALIRVVTTGKHPTMRYLARTHRVSVAWLHEVCKMKEIKIGYEETSRMCADFSQRHLRTPQARNMLSILFRLLILKLCSL